MLFPQSSDFKVVAGHFAAEQTPLEMLGSVSNPNSEGLLPAFSPCPAAAWQQKMVEIQGSWHGLGLVCLWGASLANPALGKG